MHSATQNAKLNSNTFKLQNPQLILLLLTLSLPRPLFNPYLPSFASLPQVAHQRKMFELFERREKQRKVKELREVCPDITDDEAAVALDMCNGREDEAAASLVSDPSFRRRVQNACGTGPPVGYTRRNNNNGGNGGNTNWPGRPNGPRPKYIDPATLGGSVFVGSFRGKGFQGIVKGPVAKLPPQHRGGASGASGSHQKGPSTARETSEDAEEEVKGQSEDAAAVEIEEKEVLVPVEEEAEEMVVEKKDAVAGKNGSGSTPLPVSKNYALVLENSQGNLRRVTDSELKRANTAVKPGDASPAAAPAAPAEEEEEKEAPLPTRASARSTSGLNVSIDNWTIKLSAMNDEAGAAWLAKMAPEMAGKVLQALGDADPMRAITLQELMETAGNPASKETEQEQKAAPISTRKSPRTATKKPAVVTVLGKDDDEDIEDAEGDSEATIIEEGKTSSRPRRAAASKKKATAAAAAFDDELDDDEDFISGSNKKLSRQNSGNKRRKSSPSNEEAAIAAAAAAAEDTAVAMETDQQQQVVVVESEKAVAAAAIAAPAPAVASRRPSTASNNSNHVAISSRGHTNRGRVKQKSHKNAELLEVGALQTKNGWHNAGYIFPEGFKSRTLFRSSVSIDQLCVHECFIIGKGGEYWPAPTFKVVALDRREEPLIAKSCTGCWTGILKRINSEIEARRKAGEDLPPPPKTAIAGPEYFGLNQPNITFAIEALDPEHECLQYWSGKEERMLAAAGLPSTTASGNGGAPRPPRAPRASGAPRRSGMGGGRGRRRNSNGSDSEGEHGEEGEEAQYTTNKWSSVSRTDRYRKRLEDNGEDTTNIDADNPVPEIIDPITLEPVIRPAISPYGHVMGAATWRAVLAENSTCPFTKQPLRFEQCKILTVHNIESFRDEIIR